MTNNNSRSVILEIKSLNVSEKKGTIKNPVNKIELNDNGIVGDAHAGLWHRQVSLLGTESIEKFSREEGREIGYGEFAENITTSGGLLYEMKPFDRLISDKIELEITQIGKKCHGNKCSIFRETGNCIMPNEGVFAKVIKGGSLSVGEKLNYYPKIFQALVITLSDRAYRREYEDQSGPLISRLLEDFYAKENRQIKIKLDIIPDETGVLATLLSEAREKAIDLVFTTGGTGIGPRDITPETVRSVLDREIPGIMEIIRLKYGIEKPAALLSRSIAGVMGKTLVFTLPGSPKAVKEYCAEIFPVLHHAFLMMEGIDAH
jgi:molybdopterin adenylyltransferase